MSSSSFSPKAVILLVSAAIALFAASVLLHAYDNSPRSRGNRAQPGSFSVSAIGHAGFYDTLRRLKRPALRSVGNTLAMTGVHGTLIVAEPNLEHVDSEDGRRLMRAPRLLLVLPKWRGKADKGKPSWVEKVAPASLGWARSTLHLVTTRASVFRDTWPDTWTVNETGVSPTDPEAAVQKEKKGVIQLLRPQQNTRALRPIVATDKGILVGELRQGSRRIWVLSDPDVLNNHGIVKGDNAAFMVALVDKLRRVNNTDMSAPIVFDETVHGFQQAKGSPVKLLFRFPFVVVTLLICLTAAMMALAGTRRFGKPVEPKPVLDFGKAGLIGNSARLLDYAGHHAVVLKRYIRMTVRSVAHALHVPQNIDEPALLARLDRIGKTRGTKLSCAAIVRVADGISVANTAKLNRLFEAAQAIHRWKGEILHGPSRDR